MTDVSKVSQVAERLRASIAEGLFPAAALPGAQSLLDRFDRPLRVALMGLPAAGKSAVFNLLVGETVVPENLTLPRLQLRHGPTPVMSLFFADGSTDQQTGRDLAAAAARRPVSVILDLPLQSLALINPMELSAGASLTDQARSIGWASKHADVFIWCSETFTENEQELWHGAPTVVKDQGLLLITKTDLRGDADKRRDFFNRIVQVADDEFSNVLPLSTSLAKQAFAADGSFDREVFRASGALGLVAEIKCQIEKIRQADAHTAIMIMLYNDATMTPTAPVVPKFVTPKAPPQPLEKLILTPQRATTPFASPPMPVKTPAAPTVQVPRAPAPFSAQLAQRGLKSAVADAPAIASDTVPARPELQEIPSAKAATAVVKSALTAREDQVLRQAVDSLVDHAKFIQSTLPISGKTQWPQIVSQTAEAVATVAQLLQTSESSAPCNIAKDVTEIQDLLMLIQLEQGAAPAHDAICLLIQLKRDLEFAIAA